MKKLITFLVSLIVGSVMYGADVYYSCNRGTNYNVLPGVTAYISKVYITNNAPSGTHYFEFYDAPSTNKTFTVNAYSYTRPVLVEITKIWTNVLTGVSQTNTYIAATNQVVNVLQHSASYKLLFRVPVTAGQYVEYSPDSIASFGLLLSAPTNCGIRVVYSTLFKQN